MVSVVLTDYWQAVSHAASNFQFLEETLKMYFTTCFKIVELSVAEKIEFKFTYKDVERLSLGRLVVLFSKYSSNEELLAMLRGLPEKRNSIAHQAYLLTQAGMEDPAFLQQKLDEVRKVSEKAAAAVQALFSELRRVTGLFKELRRTTG